MLEELPHIVCIRPWNTRLNPGWPTKHYNLIPNNNKNTIANKYMYFNSRAYNNTMNYLLTPNDSFCYYSLIFYFLFDFISMCLYHAIYSFSTSLHHQSSATYLPYTPCESLHKNVKKRCNSTFFEIKLHLYLYNTSFWYFIYRFEYYHTDINWLLFNLKACKHVYTLRHNLWMDTEAVVLDLDRHLITHGY